MELVERERELAQLEAMVLGAKAGEAGLALIEGPAGIGKTQLMAELRRRAARDGMVVLSARGSELEREFPFGVVRQLLEPTLTEQSFEGAAEPARTVFGTTQDGETFGDASFGTLHGLYWLTLNLAEEQPLLLCIDDLHWADRASLRYLAYVLRRVEGVPILIAAGLRSTEPGVDPALLAEIIADPNVMSVQPSPLSRAASRALIERRLGTTPHESFAAACFDATGGNPLLLRQLLTALESEGVEPVAGQARVVREIGPRAVSRTVMLRLARLSPEAKAVAQTVAVLGEDAALPAVAGLAELDESATARATGELAQAEILRDGTPLGFVHALVRDAVYRELPPGERELQHARAARLLDGLGASAEHVAAHLLLTAPRGDEWVAKVLQQAGRAASHRGAADSAPAYFERALNEPIAADRRPRLLFELGLAQIQTDGTRALEILREAHATLDDPVSRAIAAAVLVRVLMFREQPAEAAELARSAAAELPPELEDIRHALRALELATTFFEDTDWAHLPYVEIEPRGDLTVGEKMIAAVSAMYQTYAGGTADHAVALSMAALEGGQLIAADNALLAIAAIRPLVLADRPEAIDAWETALAAAHRRGSVYELAGIHLWYGFTQYFRGELADAEETLRVAYDEALKWGFGVNGEWFPSAFLCLTLNARGKLQEARSIIDGPPHPGEGTSDAARVWRHAHAALLLAEGRWEDAIAEADECARLFGAMPNPSDFHWRSLKAYALHRLGRDEEAEGIAAEELELAKAWGAPGTIARSMRTLGRTRGEAGIPLIEEAIAILEGTPARLELARTVAAMGTALRRFGRPTDAREPLRRALDLATQCEANLLADEIRGELQAVGVRPRNDAAAGVDSLTPSERRVVDLAAAGGTNRRIAQELYVTPKTVEVHLSNAYRKLGIRGRRDLAQALTG